MDYRNPPPTMEYALPVYRQDQPANISRTLQQNFHIPPPPLIPNYNIPQPPSGLYNPYPTTPPWGPKSEARSYNAPFCPPPLLDCSTFAQGHFMGPTASPFSNQNKNAGDCADDKEWVNQFTKKKLCKSQTVPGINNSARHETKLKIFEARLCLEECHSLLEDLKSVEKDLTDTIETSTPSEWQEMCQIVKIKKVRLVENIQSLSDPVTVKSLKVSLLKRRKKRAAMKRRCAIQNEEKAASLKRQQQLHLSIDTWLEEMQQSIEKVKLEESLKQQADIVLSDVTRKKAEALRQLTLISMLLKLRRIRVQAAANRGERTSVELVNIFESVIEKLQTFWSDQLKDYNLEEKGLRVMLEEATEDTAKNKKSLHQRILSKWQRVMFGGNTRVNDFYTIAERDMDEFIKIRHDWDKFVVPCGALMASAMPIGWVLPVKPSSEQWEKLLQTNQSEH